MSYNVGPEKMEGLYEGGLIQCPCCEEYVSPIWDGADGVWICPNDYEELALGEDEEG